VAGVAASAAARAASAAGALYIVTFVTSIPVLGMYDHALGNVDFVFGAGSDLPVVTPGPTPALAMA
jgi:hypothetical protein